MTKTSNPYRGFRFPTALVQGYLGPVRAGMFFMPFKHNAPRRQRISQARYKVTNWPAYEVGLRRRGNLTFWVDEAVLAGLHAPRRSTLGGQPRYADLAIELTPTLRLVFQLALRQAEGFARSVLALLGLALAMADHTTLSRRGRAFAKCPGRLWAGKARVDQLGVDRAVALFRRNYDRMRPGH